MAAVRPPPRAAAAGHVHRHRAGLRRLRLAGGHAPPGARVLDAGRRRPRRLPPDRQRRRRQVTTPGACTGAARPMRSRSRTPRAGAPCACVPTAAAGWRGRRLGPSNRFQQFTRRRPGTGHRSQTATRALAAGGRPRPVWGNVASPAGTAQAPAARRARGAHARRRRDGVRRERLRGRLDGVDRVRERHHQGAAVPVLRLQGRACTWRAWSAAAATCSSASPPRRRPPPGPVERLRAITGLYFEDLLALRGRAGGALRRRPARRRRRDAGPQRGDHRRDPADGLRRRRRRRGAAGGPSDRGRRRTGGAVVGHAARAAGGAGDRPVHARRSAPPCRRGCDEGGARGGGGDGHGRDRAGARGRRARGAAGAGGLGQRQRRVRALGRGRRRPAQRTATRWTSTARRFARQPELLGRTDAWHQLGNERAIASASNDGQVQLWSQDRRYQWANRYDPAARQLSGGFGWLRSGPTVFSTRYRERPRGARHQARLRHGLRQPRRPARAASAYASACTRRCAAGRCWCTRSRSPTRPAGRARDPGSSTGRPTRTTRATSSRSAWALRAPAATAGC